LFNQIDIVKALCNIIKSTCVLRHGSRHNI